MDGYARHAINQELIAKGIDPNAGPSNRERLFFKIAPPIFAVIFYGAIGFLCYSALAG